LEFNPANKSYQLAATKGFRTFIKIANRSVYEAFHERGKKIQNSMIITPYSLKIREINTKDGLKTEVSYFILPGEDFGALVRRVKVRNIGQEKKQVEILDGLPEFIPYGISNKAIKEVSNTTAAWIRAFNLDNKVPYFRLGASAEDTAEVSEIREGHFYLAVCNDGVNTELLTPLIDQELIFGYDTALENPDGFYNKVLADYTGEQTCENHFMSAMEAVTKELKPGREVKIDALYGRLPCQEKTGELSTKAIQDGYFDRKEREVAEVHNYYLDRILTVSSSKEYNHYSRQTFLDNFLRGGLPVEINNNVYYIFSRKHGDLERDYNYFYLEPGFYSQGNGNYRDVNQNRRCDNFLNRAVRDYNIRLFASLLQPDGYNPLVIKGERFYLHKKRKEKILKLVNRKDRELMQNKLEKSFSIAELTKYINDFAIRLECSIDDFIKYLYNSSHIHFSAEHGEGYWVDH
ncbi:MAG TPA: hypothetical protein VKY40_03425, partial [Halanaerobiales bacterium]|nr:hypothetical protein [Halanaerobiales bacterium]